MNFKRHRRLYLKFLLTYFIFGILCILVQVLLTSPLTLNMLTKEKASELYKQATRIAGSYAGNFYSDNISTDYVMDQLSAIDSFTNNSVWIVNSDGNVLYNSREKYQLGRTMPIENFDATDTGSSYYMIGDFYGQFKEEMLSVLAPITYDYEVKGYVAIHTSMAGIEDYRDQILLISIITIAVVFVISLAILIVFTKIVYIPLKKITKATEEYAEGNFKYELKVDKDDEIGYLAASLNYMAGELSNFEDNQKKFIANVSHDFRSPLTSIRGYIQAMVDGTIPPEMYEKYLGIVLNETERLTKLTNSMLTLNNLNIKGLNLDITEFDINKVIRDTVATFEGTCTSKKIRIQLVLTGEKMLVSADMGKIQQVLYNLIDNAIKFSHTDSVIRVETTEKNEKVFVSIKDSGIGIPKENLKHIFDRFYKTDHSRGKDKKGTGLGLAITKEVISAHKENINVISTVDVGTEFIFTLSKSRNNEED